MRCCKKVGCPELATASCAFSYDDRQVWIASLITDPHPASFDLCASHAQRFVAPVGWELHDLRPEAVTDELHETAQVDEVVPADDPAEVEAGTGEVWEPEPARSWEPEPAVSRALF